MNIVGNSISAKEDQTILPLTCSLQPVACSLQPSWQQWTPTAKTCLCFIRRGEEILLIRKKRGIGAGKINGPGGHLEPGETALEAAVREVQEELRVTPLDLKMVGELSFQFVDEATGVPQQFEDGISGALHTVVFLAEDHEGEPQETAEAIPHWIHQTKIPFHEMWEDDEYWLPGMLEGKTFKGFFYFDGDKMLSRHVEMK